MNCPDCDTPMESEDASSEMYRVGREFKIIACNYFCPDCQSYFRWSKANGFRRQNDGIDIRSMEV